MAAFTLLLLAAVPATPIDPAKLTTQQLFDAATSEQVSMRCFEAVRLFEALEARKVLKPSSLPEAVAALRKGICLQAIGRAADGEAAIQSGLPIVEKAGENFATDVAGSATALGDAAISYQDYDGAITQYKRALALQSGMARLSVLARLSKATAFDGGQEPLKYSEEALTLLAAEPKPNKALLAAFHTLHARILLNQGRVKEGYDELKAALALSGGLSMRVSLDDMSMRSDLAIAASLAGKDEEARNYLVYTGAGRIAEARFRAGRSMPPPLCGDETGLRPEDVAVVELGIADDGSISHARTIYSRGNRAVAAAFAKAVGQWYWDPKIISAVPIFYRVSARVEMRCSMSGGNEPNITTPIRSRLQAWLDAQFPQLPTDRPALPARTQWLRDSLAGNLFDGKPMQRAAALVYMADMQTGTSRQTLAANDAAMTAAVEAKAPAEVQNWLRIQRLLCECGNSNRSAREALLALADDPGFAADPMAAATARLLAAQPWHGGRVQQAPAILESVATSSVLADRHPLRQAARLSLANIAAASGDIAAAQRHFASTGLTEQQCALIGVKPALRRTGADSDDYPMSALRMGFEGWVNLEYDITADGKAALVRPVIAYPPLVFVEAASGMAKDFRYEASYRPENGTACSAERQTINFSLPR